MCEITQKMERKPKAEGVIKEFFNCQSVEKRKTENSITRSNSKKKTTLKEKTKHSIEAPCFP